MSSTVLHLNSFNSGNVHVLSCLCVGHLCELLRGCGQYGHSAVQFGKEFIRQMSQTRPACPFQDHPQTSLNLQHFGALEPTPRWACERERQTDTHTHTHTFSGLGLCLTAHIGLQSTHSSFFQELKLNYSGAFRIQAIRYHPQGCQCMV